MVLVGSHSHRQRVGEYTAGRNQVRIIQSNIVEWDIPGILDSELVVNRISRGNADKLCPRPGSSSGNLLDQGDARNRRFNDQVCGGGVARPCIGGTNRTGRIGIGTSRCGSHGDGRLTTGAASQRAAGQADGRSAGCRSQNAAAGVCGSRGKRVDIRHPSRIGICEGDPGEGIILVGIGDRQRNQ